MALDIRTLLLVLVLSNVVMACTLWFAFSGNFRDGLAKWVLGSLVQSVAWVLFATRGVASDVLSVYAAHPLMTLGICLHGAALIEFQQRKSPRALLVLPPAVMLAALLVLPGTTFSLVIVSSAVYVSLATLYVTLLLGDRETSTVRTRRVMIAAYGLIAVAFLGRILAWLVDPERTLMIDQPTPVQSMGLLVGVALVLLLSFGFLLMHKERSDEAIRRLATTDPLTGVFNRRTFLELAERELARCQRSGEPLRLLMVDIDHFKRINDTHGHLTGDEVLSGFAHLVSGCLRKSDLFVRYGGEEFSVLLPGADEPTAEALAERIRIAVEAASIDTRSGPIKVTVSVGICGDAAANITNLDSLLVCADRALYRAKKAGRNRVESTELVPEARAA